MILAATNQTKLASVVDLSLICMIQNPYFALHMNLFPMLNCHPFMADQVAPRPVVLSLNILPGGLLERCQAYSVEVEECPISPRISGMKMKILPKRFDPK